MTKEKAPAAGSASPVPENKKLCIGTMKVHESVLISLARRAATNVSGVLRLGENSLVGNLAEIVGSKKVFDKSILVDVNEENSSITISVRIVVKFGFHVPTVAAAVQKAIYDQITSVTGMQVADVDVFVIDLEEEKIEEESSAAADDLKS